MREDLSLLDELDAPDDWRQIEQRAPSRPPIRSDTRRRLVAGVTAIIVAVAAGALLVTRFDRSAPLVTTPTPVSPSPDLKPVGEEGTLLFPEIDPKVYGDMQAKVDAGGHVSHYVMTPQALADRFIETVMGWYPVPVFSLEATGREDGETIARVTNPKSGATATITLVQPVRTGDGGVWAVDAVTTEGATIGAMPGQIIEDGSPIQGTVQITGASHAAWGFVVGETTGEPSCFARGGDAIQGATFALATNVPADRASGMDCGTEAEGYLWVASARYEVDGEACGPLCGDSSPWGLVTIVPILVSLPENQLASGLSTYKASTGWKLDYPDAWSLSGTEGPVVVSNRSGRDAEIVRLSISPVDVGLLDLADHDSSFPLDISDFATDAGGDRVAEYQGNAERYRATLSIGTAASTEDVQRAKAVISSIRFPSIREGDDLGIWHSLGNGGYPAEIGTPAFLSDTDIGYLVRAPAGNYALGPNIESCGEGENTTWDRDARQILYECPYGPDVRYELDGTPVAGNPAGYTDPLHVYRVIVAWDGSFLVTLSEPITVDPANYWS
jgi:hypothetical protein